MSHQHGGADTEDDWRTRGGVRWERPVVKPLIPKWLVLRCAVKCDRIEMMMIVCMYMSTEEPYAGSLVDIW